MDKAPWRAGTLPRVPKVEPQDILSGVFVQHMDDLYQYGKLHIPCIFSTFCLNWR